MVGKSSSNVAPKVSVVVLSHRRPHLLPRVVHGIAQLDYPNFEVVVVGDQNSIEDYGLPSEWAARIRYAKLQDQNICKSRNIGLTLSSGEIVAFIDDDAVPEPNWLSELVVPFQTEAVAAVAGAVRGANGLRMEWTGGWFDRASRETPTDWTKGIKIASSRSQIKNSRFLALMGVNTAFRRDAVVSVGGFDEAYQYYLDETDLALRLARAGWAAAYVAEAEVHHLREANVARDSLRTPRNLFQIAASKAYFCHRHLPPKDVASALAGFKKRRIAELDPYIRLGTLRRSGRDALISQMERGLLDGAARQPGLPFSAKVDRPGFRPLLTSAVDQPLRLALISGWGVGPIMRARKAARHLADAGFSVTCISFLSGPQTLSVSFDRGVWLHRGGTWQIIDFLRRGVPIRRRARAQAELIRVSRQRGFDLILQCGGKMSSDQVSIDVHSSFGRICVQSLALTREELPKAAHEVAAVLSDPAQTAKCGADEVRVSSDSGRPDLAGHPYIRYNKPRAGIGG